MTQRLFDIENEKDMADLWCILPDDVFKITKLTYNDTHDLLWYNNGETSESPFGINWHDKTEITRPVNYEDMIGCVGWFADYEDGKIFLGVLSKADGVFRDSLGRCYKSFCPAKKSELKFWGE